MNKECIVTRMLRVCVVALVFAATGTLSAQDGPPRPTPLKIQLVLSRYQGEKKVSSVPYTLSVIANDNNGSASVRMGVQVPIPTQVIGAAGAIPSYNYKDIGTNIDCNASTAADGSYKVSLTVADSSVYFQEAEPSGSAPQVPRAPGMGGMPAFRSFTSTFRIWLRDGQTSQYTSVTDQVSGQVLKIDATLTVLK
jgi:hypothetical protein